MYRTDNPLLLSSPEQTPIAQIPPFLFSQGRIIIFRSRSYYIPTVRCLYPRNQFLPKTTKRQVKIQNATLCSPLYSQNPNPNLLTVFSFINIRVQTGAVQKQNKIHKQYPAGWYIENNKKKIHAKKLYQSQKQGCIVKINRHIRLEAQYLELS
jgi:hypothetical protein